MDLIHKQLKDWLLKQSDALQKKQKLPCPFDTVCLQKCGFVLWKLPAEKVPEKIADWVLSKPNEGRLHAWEMKSGEVVIHWDEFDPSQSVKQMVQHLWVESPTGKKVLIGVFVASVIGAFSNIMKKRVK